MARDRTDAAQEEDARSRSIPAATAEEPTGSAFMLDAGLPANDPAGARQAMRRMRIATNRLSAPDRLFVLDCQGRSCRRRLGEVLTHPQRGGETPDGVIEPNYFTDGPVFVIFGPFDGRPVEAKGEYRLRGSKESMTAPTHSVTLRGHLVRADGTLDPAEVPLGPGRRLAITCGCGHRNTISLTALSQQVELVRAARDSSDRV